MMKYSLIDIVVQNDQNKKMDKNMHGDSSANDSSLQEV